MNNDFFNKYEFKEAIDSIKIDPYLSRELFEKYLEKYPKDYCAYSYYASVLLLLGDLDKAREMIDYYENYLWQGRFLQIKD